MFLYQLTDEQISRIPATRLGRMERVVHERALEIGRERRAFVEMVASRRDYIVTRECANPDSQFRQRITALAQQARDRQAGIARAVELHRKNHIALTGNRQP